MEKGNIICRCPLYRNIVYIRKCEHCIYMQEFVKLLDKGIPVFFSAYLFLFTFLLHSRIVVRFSRFQLDLALILWQPILSISLVGRYSKQLPYSMILASFHRLFGPITPISHTLHHCTSTLPSVFQNIHSKLPHSDTHVNHVSLSVFSACPYDFFFSEPCGKLRVLLQEYLIQVLVLPYIIWSAR